MVSLMTFGCKCIAHTPGIVCCVEVRMKHIFALCGKTGGIGQMLRSSWYTDLVIVISLFFLQYRLVCQDLLAQHPVPLRPITPDPATLCSQGAVLQRVKRLQPLLCWKLLHFIGFFSVIHRLTKQQHCIHVLVCRGQGGITEGLVKGALSVAASAYKALFTGPNCSIQVGHTASLLSNAQQLQ